MTIKLPDGRVFKDGEQIRYNGKIWTVQGKKLVRPIPADLLSKNYVDKWIVHLTKVVDKK